ncbi:helix-turn-helix domain-containing protein [Kiloniella laminariae]|uniref:helix-turn-helix domain-containing protein n=1 Tax=Kiloniella laminariae TaxID=454162 RepID=UPI0003611373|nr:XRE family transcriptional regulator [Kiloniella laminariae]
MNSKNPTAGVTAKATISGAEQSLEPLKLGMRLRQFRKQRDWTLEEASRRTGLARSTLSKIENDQMSPTFDVVQKLVRGLEIDIPQLFTKSNLVQNIGRRALTRAGEGAPHPTATYEHELLCTEISNKRMIPFKSVIRARDIAEFSELVRHNGEEFLYVLEGMLTFYSEFYEPVSLSAGDSLYYDSGMGHACVSTSPEDAVIIWISTPNAH